MKLSVILPVYNEALAIREVLNRVLHAPLAQGTELEVIVADDGSTDSTVSIVHEFLNEHPQFRSFVILHRGLINHGKGAAVRAGMKLATGDIVIIQDGDLEYSPMDYPILLRPFEDLQVQVVYGSRFLNGIPPGMRRLNRLANLILSFVTSTLYRVSLTDEATGYKVFRRSVLDRIHLHSRGFEFCPELTSKVLQAGYSIVEVPIRYNPRGILEGNKIKARDGFIAVWWLLKLKLASFRKRKFENKNAKPRPIPVA